MDASVASLPYSIGTREDRRDVPGLSPEDMDSADVPGLSPEDMDSADVSGLTPADVDSADVPGLLPADMNSADVPGLLPEDVDSVFSSDGDIALMLSCESSSHDAGSIYNISTLLRDDLCRVLSSSHDAGCT